MPPLFYSAFGLNISSELLLPELMPGDDSPQVAIRLGDTPLEIENPLATDVFYQATAEQCLIKIDHVGRFLVQGGKEIIVQPRSDCGESKLRVFLLGFVFSVLLSQRDLLVIHASAIHTPKGAVIFAGPSGGGKSTIAGAFLERGYPLLTDDICAIQLQVAGAPLVLPAYPRLRLWADALDKLGKEYQGLEQDQPEIEKYNLSLREQFSSTPAPLYTIYLLKPSNLQEISILQLKGFDKAHGIIRNIACRSLQNKLGKGEAHFLKSLSVTQARVIEVTRPKDKNCVLELANRLEADFS